MRFQIRVAGWLTLDAPSYDVAVKKTEEFTSRLEEDELHLSNRLTLGVSDKQRFKTGDLVMLRDASRPQEILDEGPAIILDEGYQGNGSYTVEILPRAREKNDPDGLREVDESQMWPLEAPIEKWWREHGWNVPPRPKRDDD